MVIEMHEIHNVENLKKYLGKMINLLNHFTKMEPKIHTLKLINVG
jgi:hypothetical protein